MFALCGFSDSATRIAYFLYNSSSTSIVTPRSLDVAEPTASQLQTYLSFAGYSGSAYGLLSSNVTLYGRKQAFVILLLERVSDANVDNIKTMLQATIRSGEC